MNESRTKKGIRNMAAGAATQIILNLLSFVTRTIFVKCLSKDYLGVEGLFSSVLTILSLAELGISSSLIYAMYKPAAENDRDQIKRLVNFYKIAYRYVVAVVFVVGFFLSFFLDYLVKDQPKITEDIQIIFWLFLFNTICSYLLAYKQSIIIVNQDKYVVSITKLFCKILQLSLQAILLWTTHAYYIYLFIQIIITILNNLIIAGYVNKKYPWLHKETKLKLPDNNRKELFKNIKALSISRVAGVVANGADNFIIAKILGITSVGIVSNYNMVFSAANSVIWGSLDNMIGNIGNFNANSTLEKRRKIFDEIYLVTYWFYTFLCVCLLVLINPFISLWLGDSFTVGTFVVYVLVFNVYVNGMNYPLYSFRTTMGLFNKVKYSFVASAILNIVTSVLLGMQFGLMGVYIATPISRLLTSEFAEMRIVTKQILEKGVCWYIKRYIISGIVTVLIYGFTNFIVELIPFCGIVTFLGRIFVCVITCNLLLLLFFCRTKVFTSIYGRAKVLLSERKG